MYIYITYINPRRSWSLLPIYIIIIKTYNMHYISSLSRPSTKKKNKLIIRRPPLMHIILYTHIVRFRYDVHIIVISLLKRIYTIIQTSLILWAFIIRLLFFCAFISTTRAHTFSQVVDRFLIFTVNISFF